MRVAITGASGLIGTALVPVPRRPGGHEVVRLVRRPATSQGRDPLGPGTARLDRRAALDGVDAVVHLAGENIAGGRWTEAQEGAAARSRVGPTRLLAETLAGLPRKPQVLVSASAIGYYGDRGDAWLSEATRPPTTSSGRSSVEWEGRQRRRPREAGIRVVRLRIGIVLSPLGGALAKMLPPFKAGVGGVVGPGTQYLSWIALDDLRGRDPARARPRATSRGR